MIRQTFTVLALASIVGCSSGSGLKPFASGPDREEAAQLAAYAATARYPADAKPSSDLRAAALIDPKGDEIRIANLSDQPLRDVNVWINGTFVHKVSVIPAHGTVTVDRKEFYDPSGKSMAQLNAMVHRVEIQSGDHLYAVGDARL
jgi:hypothetical protein